MTPATAGLREASARYCTYLLRHRAPEPAVAALATRLAAMGPTPSIDRFDRWLLATAGRGPLRLRLADSYARLTRPRTPLRQHLILALAVLETHASTYRDVDRNEGGRAKALWDLTVACIGITVWSVLGVVLLGPVHLLMRGRRRD